jgi:two-component system response regulator HydG
VSSHRVLVVDDDADMCAELERMLTRRGFAVVTRQAADAAFELLRDEDFDVVVTDLNMRGMNGIELCDRIVQNRRDIPVVLVTGFGSMEAAIAAIRAGAFDFLTKPFNADQLVVSIERAIRHRELEAEVKRLRREVTERTTFGEILGASTAMQAVFDMIERVADSDATVLVTAESGAGKELVARAIHQASKRKSGPLIAINCAAMPEALLESELFGHVKGAFTDAKTTKRGLFVEASGGTLFLDELAELPLGMQAKLLRALEERKVRPVGATTEIDFDVRIVAATNQDLETLALEKRFREDLYYRVNVVHIEVPPLRSRGNDVLLLAQTFVERFAKRHGKTITGIAPEVAAKLLSYSWPGNVRELQNSMERAVALARFEQLVVDDLPPRVRDYKPSHVVVAASDPTELVTLEEVEKQYIARVMEAVAGNKTEATKVLGIDRSTLYRKLERYGIKAPE